MFPTLNPSSEPTHDPTHPQPTHPPNPQPTHPPIPRQSHPPNPQPTHPPIPRAIHPLNPRSIHLPLLRLHPRSYDCTHDNIVATNEPTLAEASPSQKSQSTVRKTPSKSAPYCQRHFPRRAGNSFAETAAAHSGHDRGNDLSDDTHASMQHRFSSPAPLARTRVAWEGP